MAPLSLKIILDEGAVTRTVKFDSSTKVVEAQAIIKEKVLTADDGKEYALFLTSADDDRSGIWLEPHRPLDYYMLRDGDSLLYLNRTRNLRVRMLDGSLKTLQVDESKNIGDLMLFICGRIGITNHDEYGLCQEESMEPEEKDGKPVTGTLTLKRKTQQRERDAKMEQLSKKLKTDDNVEWLDQHKTLREMGVDPKETLLLKRRLFYSDRNVDSRDPVQLNLLYVQTRDAILNGRHPVTEDQALEFAAIQCQIHFGDFQEDKHKPGLIENLNEYLPEQYSSSWGAEKKILKLYRKYHGLNQLEAKHLYTKTARELPTYGVTFFLVKEKQKGKQKMVPRLLGINSEAILRLDEVTKEIIQTWPLTHVKTYRAGNKDTFSLNFGDYSEKEYCVKTRDALRIRDILEGYIDIIRKRLCGPYSSHHAESGAIVQDSVHASRGNTITHVTNTPSKVVEQSFVGPSSIVPFEQGSSSSQGTQIMTVKQLIVTNKGSVQQQAVSGEVAMRSDMSPDLIKKLNRMNSNSVKIVTLLSDPTEANIEQVRGVMKTMEEDMPIIQNGIKESADKQKSEEAKKKLLDELNELNNLVANASQNLNSQNVNPENVQEGARRIADLTTQMYFSLDPRTQRRSELLRRSRKSFIQDEKTEATLHRASFIVAAAAASHAVDTAYETIDAEYQGPSQLSDRELRQLEAAAVDKLGKLNAAVALFLAAHSDSKNIDYPAAVNSMNTIKELLPALAADAKALSEAKDDDSRKELVNEIKNLCSAARKVCMLTGCDDREKLQEAANGYADVSGRLVYVFGTGNPRVSADKENEIMELAEDVGRKTTLLLVQANELTEAAGAAGAADEAAQVDAAGVACADAARDLLAIAQVCAPSIHEPHCRSAVSAAAEALAAHAQRLAAAWRPLLEPPHTHAARAPALAAAALDLARALDNLKGAYANLECGDMGNEQANVEVSPEQVARLRFITGVTAAREAMKAAQDDLDKPVTPTTLTDSQINGLHDNIAQKMAQINAAVASLLQAKSDPRNPDHATAELAIATITELMPEVVKDSKAVISTCKDDRVRQVMLDDIRTWCRGMHDVCTSSASEDHKDLEDAAKKFAQASKKLSFVFSPRARKAREQLMLELFETAHKQAMQMAEDTNKMADSMGGASGARLRDLSQDVQDSARTMQNTLMVAGPTLEEARCRATLASSSAGLQAAAARLAAAAGGLQDDETGCRVLAAQLHRQRAALAAQAGDLQRALADITATLEDSTTVAANEPTESPEQKAKRLKFIASASVIRNKAQEAEQLLDKPVTGVKLTDEQARELEGKLSHNLAVVNSAIAALIQSKTDRQNPNYDVADQAIETVSDLIPAIINDSKALSATCKDEASRQAMLKDIHQWCEAIQAVCDSAGNHDLAEFVDSAQQFAVSSKKLNFKFKPLKFSRKELQLLELSAAAVGAARQMSSSTRAAAAALPTLAAAQLRVRAAALHHAAGALHTTAQLAPSPCEPRNRAALLVTSDALVTTAGELVAETRTHDDARCRDLAVQLDKQKQELDKAVQGIRNTCNDEAIVEDPAIKEQRLKFVASVSNTQDKLKLAEKLLDQPTHGGALTEQQTKDVQGRLSHAVAQVNAAVAAIIVAKSDPSRPNYSAADHSVSHIAELMPLIANDTKALSGSCKDEASRQAMVQDMRTWCDAIKGVCDSAVQDDPKELDKTGQKFVSATNRLQFAVGSRRDPAKEREVLRVSSSACEQALQLAEEARAALPARADALANAARALHTAAQLTAPTIHERESKRALACGADAVVQGAASLAEAAQRSHEPGVKILGERLRAGVLDLDHTLLQLEQIAADKRISAGTLKTQRVKFVNSASAAQKIAKDAEKVLDQPASDVKLSTQETKDVQENLSKAIAQVNVALAALINAKSDPKNPDYITAEKSLETISELVPEIIKDTKDLSTTCSDEAARQAMLKDIREWCDAIHAVCTSAGQEDTKELNDSALKLSNASQRIRFVFSARQNPVKEQQILQLCSSACDKAQQMSAETHRAARVVAGADGQALDQRAHALAAAANTLHTTAQLTAASMQDPGSQAAMLSSAEGVSSSARALSRQTSRVSHPEARRLAEEVARYRDILDRALLSLAEKVKAEDKRTKPSRPPVPVKTSCLSPRGPAPPAPTDKPRVRVVSHSDGRRASQDWLDHMRRDSLQGMPMSPTTKTKKDQAIAKKLEEERKNQEHFTQIVDEADKKLQKAEQELNKMYTKTNAPDLDPDQEDAIRKQIGQKLALVNTAAAKLATTRHPDAAIDYVSSAQSVEALSELVPDIVKDAALLLKTQDDKAKRRLLDQILALCEATRRLTATRPTDTQASNEAAVEFGDKSAVLLYTICTDVDPAQEKDVISRARAIGDSASRLAMGGAVLAARAAPLAAAGQHAARAAAALVYTAKLVAPSVHDQRCQNSLITATHDLSSRFKSFSATWMPLAADPEHSKHVAEMTAEANDLEKLLEAFRQDLAAGKLVKRRHVEKIVIEDTALRQLASQIVDAAQMRAESSCLPDDKKKSFSEYASKLRAAIRALDVANSRAKRMPNDLKKRQDLENAVQNLQVILLQSRPALEGKPQNNIIDLTDFVKDVSSEAEKLLGVTNKAKVSQTRPEIEQIKTECHKINVAAFRVLNPSEQQAGEDTSFTDILEVDHLGQECENRVNTIQSSIENLKEKDVQDVLRNNSLPLIESCSLLRFATKSALATSQSVALDETLQDLNDMEKQIDKMLIPAEGSANIAKKNGGGADLSAARMRVIAAAGGVAGARAARAGALAPALAAYTAQLRANNDLHNAHNRNKVKEHVSKVIELAKILTATTGTRVAMWQPLPSAETCTLTEQIVQELENSPVADQINVDKSHVKLVNDKELNSLLIPVDTKVEGNKKQVEEQMERSAGDLLSASGRVIETVGQKNAGVAAAAAAAAARSLAATATAAAAHSNDLMKKKRTEEASREMCWATYELLQAAELVQRDPADGTARDRLHAHLRLLGDTVNRLTRCAGSSSLLRSDCASMERALATQLQLTRAAPPAYAPPYQHCLQALQSQRDVLQKLENNGPTPREEFCKTLNYVTAAVCNSTEYAAQCKYLISISEQHKDVATHGLVDVPRLQKLSTATQESCFRVMRATDIELAKEEESKVNKLTTELHQAIKDASAQARDGGVKRELTECAFNVDRAGKALTGALADSNAACMDKVSSAAISLVDSVSALATVLQRPGLLPAPAHSDGTRALVEDVDTHSQDLINKMQALVKQVGGAPDDDGPMTWVTYDTHRSSVFKAFDALLKSLRRNGERAGLVTAEETAEEEPEAPKKSFVQIQEEEARRWLQRRPSQRGLQERGQAAATELILLATEMSEDMKGSEKDEMDSLIKECQELLDVCSKKYDNDNASSLMESLRQLRKAVERGVVSRVVEDFLIGDPALDEHIDAETDASKQKYLLEKKIAELMSCMSRVPRTARLVARAARAAPAPARLQACRNQAELLGPKLVKAAQERIASPNDKAVVERYKALLAQYAESMAKVQELCDRAVDPLDFVQTAGETMSRMLEETSHLSQRSEPQLCAYTSSAITRLATRVITASMSSEVARGDPDLRAALADAQQRLSGAAHQAHPDTWRDHGSEILRTTGEVEAVLGGENIFKKQPDADQPIYNAALNLHTAVREWSARDNEIVAVAKRMAVLMARLSEQMNNDRKRELIATSKSIVTESREVAALAKKLALECNDVRIRTNLLQVCERIPTISGQLKMLTTVKGSSLGNQDGEADREAMNMLVTNAQNLMSSVQEVVKAAVSASVKIASQRGLKWVRKHY